MKSLLKLAPRVRAIRRFVAPRCIYRCTPHINEGCRRTLSSEVDRHTHDVAEDAEVELEAIDEIPVAEAISDAIAPAAPWKRVSKLPKELRNLIKDNTRSISSTQLHFIFGELCKRLAERTAENLTRHHPESDDIRKRDKDGQHIYLPPFVYHPTFTLAYTAYRAPIQFSILERIMAEIAQRRPEFSPNTVFDFGAGCGVAPWAFAEVWPGKLQDYAGVEPSRSMVDMARLLLDDFPGIRFEASISRFLERSANSNRPRGNRQGEGEYDLSLGSYLLGELTSDNARSAATKILFDQTRSGGMIVFAEPATPWGLRCINSARSFLLDQYPDEDGSTFAADVVAPWIPWYVMSRVCLGSRQYGNLISHSGAPHRSTSCRESAASAGADAKLCTFPQSRPLAVYTPARRARHSSTGRTQFAYLVVEKRVR